MVSCEACALLSGLRRAVWRVGAGRAHDGSVFSQLTTLFISLISLGRAEAETHVLGLWPRRES